MKLRMKPPFKVLRLQLRKGASTNLSSGMFPVILRLVINLGQAKKPQKLPIKLIKFFERIEGSNSAYFPDEPRQVRGIQPWRLRREWKCESHPAWFQVQIAKSSRF